MGNLVGGTGGKNFSRRYPAQADMGSGYNRHGPGETPAIAVKHR